MGLQKLPSSNQNLRKVVNMAKTLSLVLIILVTSMVIKASKKAPQRRLSLIGKGRSTGPRSNSKGIIKESKNIFGKKRNIFTKKRGKQIEGGKSGKKDIMSEGEERSIRSKIIKGGTLRASGVKTSKISGGSKKRIGGKKSSVRRTIKNGE